jgi:hypothetical protein
MGAPRVSSVNRRLTTRLAMFLACALLALVLPGPVSASADPPAAATYSAEHTHEVRRLYLAYFLREPDAGGAAYWRDQRAAGVPLSTISAYFAYSAEFRARYGALDDASFVRLVYRNVLDREPDTGGRQYWLQQLGQGMGRSALMLLFAQSPEFRQRTGTPPAPAPSPTSSGLPPLPSRWPSSRVELGMSNEPGGATSMRATAPFGFRYQYLAGGANTGHGWSTWNPNGAFVRHYIEESQRAGVASVFSYYMLYQSTPGVSQGEPAGVHTNLRNNSTMAAYYQDLRLFFQRANEAGGTTILHVEPDLWGFMQGQSTGGNPRSVPVSVAASGVADVAGLANDAAGFAQAVVRLRDRYAPNVMLGYHLSTWAAGDDFIYSKPSDDRVRELGRSAAAFYESLGARFDIAFTDIADRDAGFRQHVYGDRGASWFTAADYHRSALYIGAFVERARLRAVLWQIPLGNTRMRAMNNTWNHFQDNKVETILDQPGREAMQAYVNAGVVAFLFGRGADGATCACDAQGDGVTNPPAINGNTALSFNADDDGGFFRNRAAAYYRAGPMALP